VDKDNSITIGIRRIELNYTRVRPPKRPVLPEAGQGPTGRARLQILAEEKSIVRTACGRGEAVRLPYPDQRFDPARRNSRIRSITFVSIASRVFWKAASGCPYGSAILHSITLRGGTPGSG
jgi:hypothetical protein